jgi:glycosyltransferase involved in cell wall biosynthesis
MPRVVLDGFPLQVRSAGVALYTEELARAIAQLQPLAELTLFGMHAALLPRRPRHHGGASPWPPNLRWSRSLLYPLIMGQPFPALPRLIALERVLPWADVFHATNFVCPRSRRIPVVVTVHDLTLLRHPELGTRRLRRLVSRVGPEVRAAHHVIADSAATRHDLIELLAVPPERIHVVHLGCHARFRPVPADAARAAVGERYGLRDPYILHVGTLEPRKNLATLIRAYARLRRERPIPQGLVLAGDRGWKYEPILRLVEDLGLHAAVQFTGPVPAEDLPALYNAADLFVYPSLYEGFGLPPLEAMACGTPVVTSNVSSLPEVVGDAALLVDPHDECALTEAMARALSDTELRQDMRARGLERARHFSWERSARETLAVYEEAMERR